MGSICSDFAVSDGQTTPAVNITMARGAVVPIHVDDPLGLLQPVTPMAVNFDFQVHLVTSKGLHHNASVQASSAVSGDFVVTFPFGTPVTLKVMSSHLKVTDQTGNPMSAVGTGVTVASGATPSAVQYVIAGTQSATSGYPAGLP